MILGETCKLSWLGYSLLVLGVLLAVAIGIAVSVGVIGSIFKSVRDMVGIAVVSVRDTVGSSNNVVVRDT